MEPYIVTMAAYGQTRFYSFNRIAVSPEGHVRSQSSTAKLECCVGDTILRCARTHKGDDILWSASQVTLDPVRKLIPWRLTHHDWHQITANIPLDVINQLSIFD